MNKLTSFIATIGYVGYLPFAPGTWASLLALPAAYFIILYWGRAAMLVIIIIATIIGILASQLHSKNSGNSDPKEVVIDEIIGQWIALLASPLSLIPYLLCFLLFRFFDIIKPGLIGIADRKIKGGFGIMLDDILAGLSCLIIIYIIQYIKALL